MKLTAGKRKLLFLLGFALPALALYVVSEAILRQNTLASLAPNKDGEFGSLVNWLPQDAKLAIEYRARYLYLKARAEKAKTTDAKVEALFNFADYIKSRDAEASDRIMAELVDSPEYRVSRRAYKAYAYLMLRPGKRTVSFKEMQDHIARLEWPEDRYAAWTGALAALYRRRPKPEQFLELLRPLLDKPVLMVHYDRFYSELERRSKAVDETGIQEQAAGYRAQIKKLRVAFSSDLLRAPLEYRVRYKELRKDLASAKKPEERLSALLQLALHTRKCLPAESVEYFMKIRTTPEFRQEAGGYAHALSYLLYDRNGKLRVQIPEYHRAIAAIEDEMARFEAWSGGERRLREIRANSRTLVAYFQPLLDAKIEYSDYIGFLETLRKEADKAQLAAIERRAAAKIDELKARKLKSFADFDIGREQ